MKIVNWLFGSFFRTIGRTIAILLMGGLLYYILASNGVGISDLFLDKVKADSWGGQLFTINNCNGNSCEMLVSAPTIYGTTYQMDNTKIWESTFNTFNMVASLNNNNLVQFLVYTTGPNTPDLLTQTNISAYITTNNGTSWCTSLTQSNQNGYYTLSCPVLQNSTYLYQVAITTTYSWNKVVQGTLKTGISPYINLSYDSNVQIIQKQQETNDAITNQTQQQQQQHQQMMDDNTTAAEDEGSSFFGNFTSEDHGGLNSIITAPLNTIRSLLNSSCTNLTLPLPFVNENLTLPCMNAIYTEHFGLFFSLYQTIILAIISYRCLRSIFFDITGFTNPDDDRIEVMDL